MVMRGLPTILKQEAYTCRCKCVLESTPILHAEFKKSSSCNDVFRNES